METIRITIPKKKNEMEIIDITAKSKKDFYRQVKKYKNWSLFAWYHRHKWFR